MERLRLLEVILRMENPLCKYFQRFAQGVSNRGESSGLFGICGSCTTGEAFAVCAAAWALVRVVARCLWISPPR